MESSYRDLRTWIIYCLIYVLCFAGLSLFLWLDLKAWQKDNWPFALATVASGSIGIALLVVIFTEGFRAMVLFAPIIKRRLEEKTRRETRQKVNSEWEAWLKRRDEAHAKGEPFDEPTPSQIEVKNNGQ